MSISSVGTPAAPGTATGDPAVPAWGTGQNRTAGNLLVAIPGGFGNAGAGPISEWSGTSGWSQVIAGNSADCVVAFWTKVATGGDAAPEFGTFAGGFRTSMMCALYEFHDSGGSTPVIDTSGSATGGSTSPLTVTTNQSVAAGGEYALGVQCNGDTGIATSITWGTIGGGWTKAFAPEPINHDGHFIIGTQAGPTSGAALSFAPPWTYSSNAPTDQAGAIIVIKAGIVPATGNGFLALFP